MQAMGDSGRGAPASKPCAMSGLGAAVVNHVAAGDGFTVVAEGVDMDESCAECCVATGVGMCRAFVGEVATFRIRVCMACSQSSACCAVPQALTLCFGVLFIARPSTTLGSLVGPVVTRLKLARCWRAWMVCHNCFVLQPQGLPDSLAGVSCHRCICA